MPHQFEAKLERFLIQNRAKTLAFATYRVKDEGHALDLLQDAMIGFVKVAKSYDEEAWLNLLYKILKRRITDFQRKQSGRSRLRQILSFSQLKSIDDKELSDDDLHTDDHNTASNPVESHYSVGDLADDFERALQTLPDRQQEAYLLRQWQGMSVKETAEIMGCSEGSVKTHLSRAMQSLKANLEEWIDDK